MNLRTCRVASLQGEIRPPSDKSLTHRAYMFASIASSPSVVTNCLQGEDCQSTLRCLRAMGLQVDGNRLTPSAWSSPTHTLDCGNSGTTARLISGLIASRPVAATLSGDESLSRRPMGRIVSPLRAMGARIEGENLPLFIQGGHLNGIRYESPVASAQIKSCVLLAGLRASGTTWLREPSVSRDHTERMLRATGVTLLDDDGWIGVEGGQQPDGFEFDVPADISSAAFWLVAAALVPGSRLTLRSVGVNPSRTGILDVLRQVGVHVEMQNSRTELGEPVADLEVNSPNQLKPLVIEGDLVPRLIDEIPVLAVLATQGEGISIIRDAKELRVKESDRIDVMSNALTKMGANIETFDDGMIINGPTSLVGGKFQANGDHRVAMALGIAGLVASGETEVFGAETIATSYPDFYEHLQHLSVF